MTPTPRSAVDPPVDDELAARLRARGLRITEQRVRVLDTVRRLQHATPEQIGDTLPGVDLATVYRTLDVLEEIGMVRHTHLGHGPASYRPAEDEHVHVICHSCGNVLDAPADLVDALAGRLRREQGFTLDRSHFTVFGRCHDCAAAGREAPAGGNKHPHHRTSH